jgi:hypothetical protein
MSVCCISVSFPSFSIAEGSFTMYYIVVWRAKRDERCACPRCRDIPYCLAMGGLSCISVSSPPFFIVKGSFTIHSSVVWRAQWDERCACPNSRDIPHYLVWGGEVMLYLGQFFTIFYHQRLVFNVFYCRLKGPKRRELRAFTFQRYFTLSGFGRVMLHLGQFSTVFHR